MVKLTTVRTVLYSISYTLPNTMNSKLGSCCTKIVFLYRSYECDNKSEKDGNLSSTNIYCALILQTFFIHTRTRWKASRSFAIVLCHHRSRSDWCAWQYIKLDPPEWYRETSYSNTVRYCETMTWAQRWHWTAKEEWESTFWAIHGPAHISKSQSEAKTLGDPQILSHPTKGCRPWNLERKAHELNLQFMEPGMSHSKQLYCREIPIRLQYSTYVYCSYCSIIVNVLVC